jgi:hypothetical protein
VFLRLRYGGWRKWEGSSDVFRDLGWICRGSRLNAC